MILSGVAEHGRWFAWARAEKKRLSGWHPGDYAAWLLPGTVGLAIAMAQDLCARTAVINPAKFPPFGDVLIALAGEIVSGAILAPVTATLITWLASLVLSFVLALLLGTALGMSGTARGLLMPIVEYLRPIPSTALIPLVILAIGANFDGALFLTIFGTLWQILPMTIRAFGHLDPVASDTARVFAFTRWQRFRWLTLPSMEPFLLTALRIGASTALVLLIGVELLTGISGIGRAIANTYAGGNLRLMYAYVLVAGLLGLALNLGLTRFSRYRAALVKGHAE